MTDWVNDSPKSVIVFGCEDLAQLANFYLTEDSPYTVVGFTVNEQYKKSETFEGKPLVSFETVEQHFPPNCYYFFAPMTGTKMNKHRRRIYEEAKKKGYTFVSYVSSKATSFSNVSIGENCFILEDNTLQPYSYIGNNVVLWSGNHIGHHSTILDHCFLTSHVVISGHCVIESHSWFGVNSTVRDGAIVGEGTLLSMGACLTRQKTDPWSVYMGVPAKKREGIHSEQAI